MCPLPSIVEVAKKYDSKIESFNFVNENWFIETDLNTPLAWVSIWVKDIFCEKCYNNINDTFKFWGKIWKNI
jgi:hypothetical protein